MQKELDLRNAMELAEYHTSVAMHPVQMSDGNALPMTVRGPAPVPPLPTPPVAGTVYRDPLSQF
jgi:hypothetical protein